MARSDQGKNTTPLGAKQFLKRLKLLRPLQSDSKIGKVIGVPMGEVFALAKEFMGMPLDEIEKLLEPPVHEGRVGAVSMMDFEARNKKHLSRAEGNFLSCISAAMISSTPGIWSIEVLRMWLAGICLTSHVKFYTNWHAQKTWQNAAQRL